MSISNPEGIFYCFNPMCDESGTLIDLVLLIKECSYLEAVKLIQGSDNGDTFQVPLTHKERREALVLPDSAVENWQEELANTPKAKDYLLSRGITEESIEFFRLGYSTKQNLILTPLFDVDGVCVGGIGRGIDQKIFKNIPGTQTSNGLYNINNAKRHATAVIVESNFDAIRVHQAGFPGVVATCGGIFSESHLEQVSYYFEKIIIMTDDDDVQFKADCRKCMKTGNKYCIGHNPGRDLGKKIADKSVRAGVIPKWSSYDGCGIIYPNGVKDAGDMTDEQIVNCIKNSVSNFEYNTWK